MDEIDLQIELHVALADETASREVLATLTELLDLEIRDLPVVVGRKRSAPPPSGARADVGLNLETLAIALATPALKQLIDVVRAWLTRQRTASAVTIKTGKLQVIVKGEETTRQLQEVAKFLAQVQELQARERRAPRKE